MNIYIYSKNYSLPKVSIGNTLNFFAIFLMKCGDSLSDWCPASGTGNLFHSQKWSHNLPLQSKHTFKWK